MLLIIVGDRLSIHNKITEHLENDNENAQNGLPVIQEGVQNIKIKYQEFQPESWGPTRVNNSFATLKNSN